MVSKFVKKCEHNMDTKVYQIATRLNQIKKKKQKN